MNSFLKTRAGHLTERMDDPDCDRETLFNTYRQFTHINNQVSRWKTLFRDCIVPLSRGDRPLQILDIGCGGGDICLKFSKWAKQQQIPLEVTGIDPDPRAMDYLDRLPIPRNVLFRQARSSDLMDEAGKYDVVISNHLVHHLQPENLLQVCKEAEILSKELVLFNDIRRSVFGYTAFGLTAPFLYRSSFIVRDGLTSIQRSFTYTELKEIAPAGWTVKKLFPYRLLLMYD
ncbi:MAG: methyltransferase domain-containing protein [Balneolaceae bacterium]